MSACAVCKEVDGVSPMACRCGAIYCHDCQDGHECEPPVVEEIVLRPHQVEFKDGIFGLLRKGHRRINAVASTGFGKRIFCAWLTKKAALEQGKRVLFVVNRRPLVIQMCEELTKRGVPHNVTMGSDTTADRGELVTVASLQTLRKRHFFHPDTGALDGRGLPEADLVLVDEAHLDCSSYKTLLHFYPDAVVIGNTATPVGPGGKSLADLWPAMYIGTSKMDLIRRGFLVPTKMYSPSEPDMEGVKLTTRTCRSAAVEKRVRECTIFANVFREWQPWSDLSTVVFAPGVEFAQWMAGEFNRRGYKAVCVTQKTTTKQRKAVFDGVNDGSIRVVVSVDVLKIGVDVPRWACAIDCQPTLQLRDFIQKAGRICRTHPGKHEAVYLDHSGSFWRHGHPDEDIAWDELQGDETTAMLTAKARQKPESPQPIACPKCRFVRTHGPKCPNCGHESYEVVRYVQMRDGRLKKQRLPKAKSKKAPAAKGSHEFQVKNWISAVCRAARAKKTCTLNQARFFYKQKTGEWPPYGLGSNIMPDKGSADWGRPAGAIYAWAKKKT